MNFKPTATVGPTMSVTDNNPVFCQSLNDANKSMAVQEYADKLRIEKFLAKKRASMQNFNNDQSSPQPVPSFVSSSTPVRLAKASSKSYASSSSPLSRGLNVDAPVFVPQNGSFYATPPSTPSSYTGNLNNFANGSASVYIGADNSTNEPSEYLCPDVMLQQMREYKAKKNNRSVSVGDVDYCEFDSTKEFDSSGGCNSSKRVFCSSNGSSITTPDSLQSGGGEYGDVSQKVNTISLPQFPDIVRPVYSNNCAIPKLPPAEFRYDRVIICIIMFVEKVLR